MPQEEEESRQELPAPDAELHVSQEEGVSGSLEEEAGPSTSQQGPRPRVTSQVPPPQVRLPGLQRRRREVEDRSLEMIREASALMRAPLNPTEAYSAYVASELSQEGEADQKLAKDMINQVLLWLHRGWLTNQTVLCDPAHPAQHLEPPPAATSSSPQRGRGRGRGRSAAMPAAKKVTRKRKR